MICKQFVAIMYMYKYVIREAEQMEFQFETPLILKIRSALGGATVIITSIFYLLSAILFGFYIYGYFGGISNLPILAVTFAVFSLSAFITGIAIFKSAKKKETVLSSGGASFGAIISIISAVVLIALYFVFKSSADVFAPIENTIGVFGIKEGFIYNYRNEIFFILSFVFSLLSFGFFLSLKKTVINNRPHRAFSILLALYSFLIAAAAVGLAVYYFVIGGIDDFEISKTSVFYLTVSVFVILSIFMTGLSAVKYYISCGGEKDDF